MSSRTSFDPQPHAEPHAEPKSEPHAEPPPSSSDAPPESDMNDMDDAHTRVADLRDLCGRFVAERAWETFHSPKNLAMSIAIEAAEIMEHVQWLTDEESRALVRDAPAHQALADELADVVIYCLMLANSAQIDISRAVQGKLTRNQKRFPPEVVRGKVGGG